MGAAVIILWLSRFVRNEIFCWLRQVYRPVVLASCQQGNAKIGQNAEGDYGAEAGTLKDVLRRPTNYSFLHVTVALTLVNSGISAFRCYPMCLVSWYAGSTLADRANVLCCSCYCSFPAGSAKHFLFAVRKRTERHVVLERKYVLHLMRIFH